MCYHHQLKYKLNMCQPPKSIRKLWLLGYPLAIYQINGNILFLADWIPLHKKRQKNDSSILLSSKDFWSVKEYPDFLKKIHFKPERPCQPSLPCLGILCLWQSLSFVEKTTKLQKPKQQGLGVIFSFYKY